MIPNLIKKSISKIESIFEEFEDNISLEQIENNDEIHPLLKDYYIGMANVLVYKDLANLYYKNEYRAFREEEKDFFDNLEKKLSTHYCFSKNFIINSAEKTSKIILYFLSMPISAVKLYFYKNSTVRQKKEIITRFKLFSAYDKLTNQIKYNLEKETNRDLELISDSDFDKLLTDSLKSYLREMAFSDLVEELNYIFDYCNYISGDNKITYDVLLSFLEDLKLRDLYLTAEKWIKEKNTDTISNNDLIEIFNKLKEIEISNEDTEIPEDNFEIDSEEIEIASSESSLEAIESEQELPDDLEEEILNEDYEEISPDTEESDIELDKDIVGEETTEEMTDNLTIDNEKIKDEEENLENKEIKFIADFSDSENIDKEKIDPESDNFDFKYAMQHFAFTVKTGTD